MQKRFASSIVRDSASGDVIVKLVNLLPVEVNTHVDLSGIGAVQPSAKRTVLTGKPAILRYLLKIRWKWQKSLIANCLPTLLR